MGLFGKKNKLGCKKNYPYRSTTFSAGGEVPNVFSISNLKIDKKINYDASKLAIVLDDYQFDKCQEAERCDDVVRRKSLLEQRDKMYDIMTALQGTIIASEGDPEGLKKYVENAVANMQKRLGIDELTKEQNKIHENAGNTRELKTELVIEAWE